MVGATVANPGSSASAEALHLHATADGSGSGCATADPSFRELQVTSTRQDEFLSWLRARVLLFRDICPETLEQQTYYRHTVDRSLELAL